ncbi:hypothetical protein KZ813_16655 [Sphingomonas sp. RHCKR7]|uniref:hypothetical protein n=1 Tax=Sphingomonas folli TaxID=2862497 RepID=UPI001CA497A9|nr:hypothetical protein [Sphingomonas folli]MBW6528476.1 hypothetical protein [Sphingomonas folli]
MIALVLALQIPAPPIVDWQPFGMQRSPDGGLFDQTSATRSGDVVNAWVRLVNVRLEGVNEHREQTDARMEVNCRHPLIRVVAYRIVSPNGAILKRGASSPREATWRKIGIGSRGADVRTALCNRVH